MRLAVTVAETIDGKWDCLATPDVPIQVQKEKRKELKGAEGKLGDKQYLRLCLFSTTGEVKRSKFKPAPKKSKKSVKDD